MNRLGTALSLSVALLACAGIGRAVRLQPLRQLPDRRPRAAGDAHHVEQQLVLQRREAVLPADGVQPFHRGGIRRRGAIAIRS